MDKLIYEELNKIKHNYWNFLDEEWKIKEDEYKHRTELKDVKNIEEIKVELQNKLGIIPIFFFLNNIFVNYKYKTPYRDIEKGLLIIYHLITGKSIREMNDYIPYSSFHEIYKSFWDVNLNELHKTCNKLLENMFSTILLRIYYANRLNPEHFKHVTLLLDGHDSRVNYTDLKIKSKDMYSYKFKKSGFRTQVITDVNEIAIYVSDSLPCKKYNDGKMFLAMKLENKLNENGCIAVDGGYNLFIEDFLENCSKYGNDKINNDNFIFPFRKKKGIKLSDNEIEFNNTFGSFRSIIENKFGRLGEKFQRFDNSNKVLKIDNI